MSDHGSPVQPVDLDAAQALADSLDVALSNHPDTDCPPVCEIGSAAADMIRALTRQLRVTRDQLTKAKNRYCEEFAKHAVTMVERDTARQDALREAADYFEAVAAVRHPHATRTSSRYLVAADLIRGYADAIGVQR